jgi:ATP-binding cassette subfamily B protein
MRQIIARGLWKKPARQLQYSDMKQLWRIIQFTRELWPYYAAVSAFTILLAAVGQLVPLFTKSAVDQITKLLQGGHANVKLVALFAFLIFLTDLGQTIFSNISGYYGDLLSIKVQRTMSERYYTHMLSLPQSYFDSALTGTIINRMSRGITQISGFMQTVSNNFLQFIFSTIFTLIIVFYYSWPVGLMLSVLYPVFVWLTTRTSEKWQGYQKTINYEQDKASGRFAEAISQVKVVKSFSQEKRELKIFSKHFGAAVETTYPQSKYWHKQDVKRRIVLNLIFLAVYAFIFVETARGAYSLGVMILLIQYTQLIRIPIFSISFLVDASQRALSNTRDYFEAMDTEPAITDHQGAEPLKVTAGAVSFQDVRFSYDISQPVLKRVSFELPADSKTALVGESGEGKTTITSLLLRLYELESGTISIDDQNVADVTQASLRSAIAVVFQEPALFSGTIKENIAYANTAATEAQIIAAAKAANAHSFIAKFEKGYDSEIGERGLKLSGGQKQRIAIARALLKDAPILILDEATSSLDSKSERLVQQALERLMKGRTTLIIAHRLSTIQAVDQIVTINKGSVDEIGSPEQLAGSGGIYAQLLALQDGSEATKKKLQNYEMEAR